MTIYRPRLTSLPEAEVRRYAGQRKPTDLPMGDIGAACREGLLLAQPQCSWQVYDYDDENFSILSDPPLLLSGKALNKHLLGCHRIAVLAVTVGPMLEDQVEQLFASGNYNAALLLDAAGSAAVEVAADQADLAIAAAAAKVGNRTSRRFSPGYGDWDLAVQPNLLPLAEGHKIGVMVTSSQMLLPRKSITAVIGFLPEWATDLSKQTILREIPCDLTGCFARKGESN